MLNSEVVEKLISQLNFEFYSSYMYLDISNYFSDENLDGFANWFMIQTQEQRDHAMLFNKYLLNNSQRPILKEIGVSKIQYKDFRNALEEAFEHEKKVTASINSIYATAYELKDFRTMQLLDWFVKEQNEEEKNTETIVKKYDLFGNDPKGLYMLDNELATRVYTAPTLVL